MNDFTKEELQIIHLDMCTYVERYKMLKEQKCNGDVLTKVLIKTLEKEIELIKETDQEHTKTCKDH
jgi:hypothetical protein